MACRYCVNEGTEHPEHDDLVQRHIDDLINRGWKVVAADLHGYERPKITPRNHIPDLVAVKETQLSDGRIEERVLVGESETCEDLATKHTEEQWADFGNLTDKNGRSVVFEVSVPSACYDEAVDLLISLKLSGKVVHFD